MGKKGVFQIDLTLKVTKGEAVKGKDLIKKGNWTAVYVPGDVEVKVVRVDGDTV